MVARLFKAFDHFKYGKSFSRAQVVDHHPGGIGKFGKYPDMAKGEICHMDIISDSCSVGCVIIPAKDAETGKRTHCNLGDIGHQVVGQPLGVFSYALSRPAMLRACEIKAERDTEVWGGYFSDTGLFKWGTLEIDDPAVSWPELRLTVDTPEDFALVERIFDELYGDGRSFSLEEIVALCREKPELVAINSAVIQKPGISIKVKDGVL